MYDEASASLVQSQHDTLHEMPFFLGGVGQRPRIVDGENAEYSIHLTCQLLVNLSHLHQRAVNCRFD